MQLVWNSALRKQAWLSWFCAAALLLACIVWLSQRELVAAWWPFITIAAATFISEDLTTINTGVLIAQGRLAALPGTLACFLGIFVGDLLLFLAGRWWGRTALARAPLKWFLTPAAVERGAVWLKQRGLLVIALSRFVPGTRLPTYFAAGALRTDWRYFVGYFFLACAVWTPLLIVASMWLGGEAVRRLLMKGRAEWWLALLVAGGLFALLKLGMQLATWRGRRALLGWWRRLTRWEFWPSYVFYPPVLVYLAYLALKHRSLTLFTAANPAIPASGFVGESKAAILDGLQERAWVARYALLPASLTLIERVAQAQRFMAEQRLNFPVVLKPDVGQRGWGVRVLRSERELLAYLNEFTQAVIIQEYVAGEEFGVFYYRLPNEARGRIFSLTHKTFPVVVGDGAQTLEELIWNDARAVCLARLYCEKQSARLHEVLPMGARVQLVELGSHCRGAIFLDGADYRTAQLEAVIDRLSRSFAGFYFGRYDIRAASLEAFQRGADFKVIELNGVTSEATHIYDPRHSLWTAYRTLCAQWRVAFAIGAQNRARGRTVTSVRELWQLAKVFLTPDFK